MVTDRTHGTFQDILMCAPPALRPVCEALRRSIVALHKEFIEVAWPRQKTASYGVGLRKMSEHYAYIAVHGAHVNLGFYHGASLPDPRRLLEGMGKNLRHVKLRDAASVKRPAVRALLRAAIADRKRGAG